VTNDNTVPTDITKLERCEPCNNTPKCEVRPLLPPVCSPDPTSYSVPELSGLTCPGSRPPRLSCDAVCRGLSRSVRSEQVGLEYSCCPPTIQARPTPFACSQQRSRVLHPRLAIALSCTFLLVVDGCPCPC